MIATRKADFGGGLGGGGVSGGLGVFPRTKLIANRFDPHQVRHNVWL